MIEEASGDRSELDAAAESTTRRTVVFSVMVSMVKLKMPLLMMGLSGGGLSMFDPLHKSLEPNPPPAEAGSF